MRRHSEHGSRSHWLLEQVQWEIRRDVPRLAPRRRALTLILAHLDRHPFVTCGLIQCALFLIAWGAGNITIPSLNRFAIDTPAAVIGNSWQIVATFASIAFAGLTVLMQLAAEPVVTSRSARQVFFEATHFRPVLAFSITASIQVGFAAHFLNRTESAIVEFAVVAITMLWIGLSYARVGAVFAKPGEALRLGKEALERDLMSSLRDAHSRAVAEERIHALAPRGWRWSRSDEEVVPVLASPKTQVLADVDFDLLTDIVQEISGDDFTAPVAADVPELPNEGNLPNAPELRIVASLGSTVEASQNVFVLANATSYSGVISRLGERLERAVRWGGPRMRASDFESSLAAVRDNIVMAVERRELGVVDDGLAVYKGLIEIYLDEQARLQAPSDSSGNLPLGREWDRLVRDLHGIVDSVSASPSQTLWFDTLAWVMSVAESCASRGVINALGNVFNLIEAAWRQELTSPRRDTSRQDALLLRLSEFGLVRRARGANRTSKEHAVEIAYTRTNLSVVKTSIESGDPELARVAIQYFAHGSKGPRDSDTPVADVGLVVIAAWVLYRFDHDDQRAEFRGVLQEIYSKFQRPADLHSIFRDFDDLGHELGVHWWEMRGRGPVKGGVIEIGTYVSLALILIGGVHLRLDATNADDVETARRLLPVIESVEKGGFAKALTATNLTVGKLTGLKTHLTSVVQDDDVALERTYSQLPLDPERVLAFRRAVAEKLAQGRTESLAAILRTDPAEQVEPPNANFGLDSLIPRWFFAETNVHADPQRLADDLVRALGRGEEDRILDLAIGSLDGVPEITLNELVEKVATAISEYELASVVVTNSYQASELLTGPTLGHAENWASGLGGDSRVVRVHDERAPYVALLLPSGQPIVRVLTPQSEVAGDEPIEDRHVIVGVSDLPDEEMDRIVAEKERTALDEARLRGSVRVRLLEHLEVSLDDSPAPPRWRLPEDTW